MISRRSQCHALLPLAFALLYSAYGKNIEVEQRVADTYGQLPLVFEPNWGQTNAPAQFLVRCRNHTVYLAPDNFTFALYSRENPTARLSAQIVTVRFEGANQDTALGGGELLPGHSNYLIGNDPKQWHTDIPQYKGVSSREIYPGISLDLYSAAGSLEYDFRLSPGADGNRIRLVIDGAEQVSINDKGDLVMKIHGGELIQTKPRAYQDKQGVRYPVAANYRILDDQSVVFELGEYDKRLPFTIDPSFIYSAELAVASVKSIALDPSGSAYIAGGTANLSFPTANAIQPFKRNNYQFSLDADGVITKLNPAGTSMVYSTYLGGTQDDFIESLAADATGAYLSGGTGSTDFPIVNALVSNPQMKGFVAKINAAGSALVYSSFFVGGNAIAINSSGAAYVQGGTSVNTFFTKLDPTGTSVNFAVQFGDGKNFINALAVEPNTGDIVVVGNTTSPNLPTLNALQTTRPQFSNSTGFVTKFTSTGNALVFSTYLGGSYESQALGVALDPNGVTYVTGLTDSLDFPVTPNAIAPYLPHGSFPCFVTELGTSGALLFSTYLIGEVCQGIGTDASGNVYVSGTGSFGHPILGSLRATDDTGESAFVTKLKPDLSAMIYSTLVGDNSQGIALAMDASGNVYLGADAVWPGNYPHTAAFGDVSNGGMAVSKIADNNACAGVVVSPLSLTFNGTGGPGAVHVTAPSGCRWNVAGVGPYGGPSYSFTNLPSQFPTYNGNGEIDFLVDGVGLNTPTATDYLIIAGRRVAITQIGTNPSPFLNISSSHSGNFTQGQQNATYTVIVSDTVNTGPTSGTVTVTAALGNALTLVSMAGPGWTCQVIAPNTCTRSDSITGGGAYPPITVTVNVAGNALSPQYNQVNLTGGGSDPATAIDFTQINPAGSHPPTVVSVTPSSGTGLSQTFAFAFNAPNGVSDIVSAQMDINAVLGINVSCYLFYVRGSNSIYLANNGGIWQGPRTIGSGGILQNDQCSVNPAVSSVSATTNTLTVNLAITFTAAYAGLKNVYMEVRSNALDSGWASYGTWTVANTAPTPDFSLGMSAGPGSVASGGTATYTVTVTGNNGFAGTVGFGVSGLPNGVTGTFNPTSVNGSGSTTLTVSTVGGVTPGIFTVDVTGTSGSLHHDSTALLTVTGATGPPAATSVTPNSGSGLAQTFAFTFTDPNGANDIASAQIDISSTLAVTGACYLYYVRGSNPANSIYLANDAGAFEGPLFIGPALTMQNSQCLIDAGASSVTISGTTLTLNLALSFKPAFAGTKNIYMEVRNATRDSGWSSHGTWTVASSGPPPDFTISMQAGPGTVAVGSSPTYQVMVTGINGFTDTVVFGVSGLPSGVTARFNPTSVIASGSTTLTIFTGGASLPNFTITVTGTSGALQHNTTTSLTITGSVGLVGPASVAPNTGTGLTQIFAFTFTDENRVGDITSAQMDINATLAVANACYLFYVRAPNAVYLASDKGVWQGPLTVGSVGTLENSQCSLNTGASSVSTSADGFDLTLSLALTFKAAFAGAKNVYMEVQNQYHDSGWTQEGTWTVGAGGQVASPPAPASVTPNTGSGTSHTFAFAFSDPNGATDIVSAQMDINATLAVPNACYLFYVRAANTLYLASDTGVWQGPLTVGSAGTLQNSQCSVNSATSSVSASGNTLTVNLALTFKAAFIGSKNIYMEVRDGTHDSGWSLEGSWIP